MNKTAKLTAEWVKGEHPKDSAIWLGGDPYSPSWEEYLSGFTAEGRRMVRAMRKAYLALGVEFYGEDMNDWYVRFSDGCTLGLSWRAWGDFRQALENKREGYMRYYMRWLVEGGE